MERDLSRDITFVSRGEKFRFRCEAILNTFKASVKVWKSNATSEVRRVSQFRFLSKVFCVSNVYVKNPEQIKLC